MDNMRERPALEWSEYQFTAADHEANEERSFTLHADVEGSGMIVELGSDDPMVFDDVEELWSMWIDLHESFDNPFSKEELEIIDALELPRPDGL